MTIGELLKGATKYLKEKNIEDPSLEAGLLLCTLLNKDRSYIYTHPEKTLDKQEVESFNELVERRSRHEPFSYIAGECGFMDSVFYVNPSVLIPREETELLVESALFALGKSPAYFDKPIPRLPVKNKYHALDVGTGSGCIAVSLAKNCDNISVDAVDISSDALSVAHKNASRYGVENRINFIRTNFLNAFYSNAKYDLIVSNPPYIPEKDIPFLSQSVKDYEPHCALTPGRDGLLFYRTLSKRSSSLLATPGIIMVECGFDQGDKVSEIFSQNSMETSILKDLAGIERVIVASRK